MIRRAVVEDFPEIFRMLVLHHAETGLVPINEDKTSRQVAMLLATNGLFVAEVGSGLAGIMGLVETDVAWYGDGLCLHDRFVYVEPEFRATRIGNELMAEAKAEAIRRNVPFVFVTVMNEARAKRRGRIAAVLGFLHVGYLVRLL